MDHEVSTAVGHINRAIEARKAEDHERARQHLLEAVRKNPDSEVAWLWLAEASDDPAERRYCLDRAIRINPESAGRRERNTLASVDPKVPAGIEDVYDPPLPPTFRHARRSSRVHLNRIRRPRQAHHASTTRHGGPGTPAPRPRWPWIVLVALVLIGIVAALVVRPVAEGERVYIAVVAPLSGPDADIGADVRDGAQLAVDDLNRRFDGADLEIVTFDDQNDPDKAADIARKIVADKRIVAVIGHSSSATTLAAAPIYQEAGVPVISGQATTNELDEYPDLFRTVVTDRVEGAMLATYAQSILGFNEASIITGTGVYEQEVTSAFSESFGKDATVRDTWTLDAGNRDQSIASIIDKMHSTPQETLILLSLNRDDARDMLLAIRRAGLSHRMLGVESMGSTKFVGSFANEPEEQEAKGFFTEGLYVASPLIFDAATGDALAFSRNFFEMTNRQAGWRAASAYDAVVMAHAAIHNSDLSGDKRDIAADRQMVLEQLHTFDSIDNALRGVTGPLYIDDNGTVPGALHIGFFRGGHLISAPVQYRLALDPDEDAIADDVKNGIAFQIGDQTFRQYRVAFVGIEMIELRDLDTSAQTFTADFFIYFRYQGDDAPTNVVFTNAQDKGLSIGDPITEQVDLSGMNYKLFRVSGKFSEPMRFEDYPWDQHDLSIRFQNPDLTQTDLVYAADLSAIQAPQSERLMSGFDRSQSFNRVPSWNTDYVQYVQFAVTSSSEDYDVAQPVEYSEFRTLVHVEREIQSFLFKNLLPLLLLTIVTYVFLWFPAEQAGARISASITALLTSAVMLNSVSNQLPDIGYTVAIEWGFFVYLGTAALLILLNVAVDHAWKAKRYNRVKRLDATIRILFPAVVLATVATYWVKFM